MMDAVHRYEGTVSRLMGDGLMALFGAPVAHEDHAVRACYAALAMQDAVRALRRRGRGAHGVPARDPGRAEQRRGGRPADLATTCTWTTRRWARPSTWPRGWSSSRAAGTACSPPSTLALVEGYVQVRSLGPMPVKGLDAPVEVFELIGAGRGADAPPGCRRAGPDALRRAATPSWRALRWRSTRAGAATARSSRWSASRGSGSRGWSGS